MCRAAVGEMALECAFTHNPGGMCLEQKKKREKGKVSWVIGVKLEVMDKRKENKYKQGIGMIDIDLREQRTFLKMEIIQL